jgi:glutamyl-tRNA synthetase
VHVPLVVGGDGKRLAKRHGDTSLRAFRQAGVSSARLVGYLAYLCGLRPRGVECTPGELIADFDLSVLPRAPVRGDEHGLRGGE